MIYLNAHQWFRITAIGFSVFIFNIPSYAQEYTYLSPSNRVITYKFEGQANCDGQPCADTEVVVSLFSNNGRISRQVKTGSDGRYSVSITVNGTEDVPVNWEISAETPDFRQVQLEGSQILQNGQIINIERSLDFYDS